MIFTSEMNFSHGELTLKLRRIFPFYFFRISVLVGVEALNFNFGYLIFIYLITERSLKV